MREQWDLEERTFRFAKQVRAFVKTLPRTVSNREDVRQLVRASGSVAANYIEANEHLGKNDFRMRMKIARKEAKESRLWLNLLDTGSDEAVESRRIELSNEADQLRRILSAILHNHERSQT